MGKDWHGEGLLDQNSAELLQDHFEAVSAHPLSEIHLCSSFGCAEGEVKLEA